MKFSNFLIILILIQFSIISGCTMQSNNLEISNIKFTPGEEILSGFYQTPTGTYYSSKLSFIITNKGSYTDRGYYSISARVYDKNGNFISKSSAGYGSPLEPGESNTINIVFNNLDFRQNIDYSTVDIGKIDIIFHYLNEDGKIDYDKVYTFNY